MIEIEIPEKISSEIYVCIEKFNHHDRSEVHLIYIIVNQLTNCLN